MAQRAMQITLDHFFRAFKDSNPFAKNRVTEVGDAEVDVLGIHGDAFMQLARRIERALQNRASTGVMLLGAAGMGKSHLLARLNRWAQSDGRAVVIFLHNVVASAERMARYLLRATLSTLAGHRSEDYCESELYRLINKAVEASLRRDGKAGVPSVHVRLKTLGKIAAGGAADASVVEALGEFLQSAIAASSGDQRAEQRATVAVEWLAGEAVEGDATAQPGPLPADDDGAGDGRFAGVFRVLARLASEAGRVLTLCIDQVDNLDDDQISALASTLHALLDHTPNLVVVTSGVRQSMTAFRERNVLPEAAWDRLAQYIVELRRVDSNEARALVETRVGRFMKPFSSLPPITAACQKESLFPLDGDWLSSRLASAIEFRPRDIISWAHSRWEEQQDLLESLGAQHWLSNWPNGRKKGPTPLPQRLDDVIDEAVRRKIAERLQERRLRPESLPPDADNLATLVYSLLAHCQNDPQYSLVAIERCSPKLRTRIYDLRVQERAERGAKVSTGVVFVTSTSKTSVASVLKRLVEDPSPPDHRVVITDEERRPLPIGPRGKDHLEKLAKLSPARFQHIKITFDAYANLDALSGLLGSARVGDLEVDHPPGTMRPVDEDEVVESLHRQSTFLSHGLLREFLMEEAPKPQAEPPKKPPIDGKRVRAKIQEQLPFRLGLTTRELARLMVDADAKLKDRFDEVHHTVRTVANDMHAERLIFATAQDDAMFLQLLATR